MEALEVTISSTLQKFEAEGSVVSEDIKLISGSLEKVKEIYQKCRKEKLNKEYQLCQLEKQIIALNNHLGRESIELSRIKEKLEESNSKVDANSNYIKQLELEKTEIVGKHDEAVKQQTKLNDEKTSLVEKLEAKSKELERVNEEWQLMSDKLTETTKLKNDAQAKLDEFMSSDVTREFKVKRLEQERELLNSQNVRLNTQLNGKIEELATLKKKKTSEVLDLQNIADSQKDELRQLSATCQNLKEKSVEDEKRIETLMAKLQKARETFSETEDHMSRELISKSKLADLYKESSEDNKKRVNELNSALLEMQKVLKETDNEKLELEAKLEIRETDYECRIKDLEEEVKKLNSELENANELLELSQKKAPSLSKEVIEGLSPAAAAASSLIKKGMTLSQIYHEYVEVSNLFEAEKDENSRLKQYMDQILQEIEEKAPALQRQKEEYEVAVTTVENLTEKFENAMAECDKYRLKYEDLVREADFTERERDRMKTLCGDLGQQVRVLIKEVEEARGGMISNDYLDPPILSSNTVSSSSQVISEHLVSFKSIEELQEQNQKLLAVVRDLSEEREKQEKTCSPEKITELSQKLDSAFEQLSQLREERTKQDEVIQTLVKQRDMYKVLYTCEDRPEISSTTLLRESQQLSSANTDGTVELEKAKANLQLVTEEYDVYRKECRDKQNELKEKIENIEGTSSQLGRENQLLKGKLEFLEEKNNSLTSRNDAISRENQALIAKSRALESALSKVQKEAAFYKQELESANEKLINLEVNLKSSVTEKNLMKGTEQRLMQENKTLIEQQRSQNVLLTNLQTIQNNLERREFDTRKTFGQQVEQLQLEVKAIRRKLDTEEQEKKTSIGSLNSQLEKIYTELDNEKKFHLETKKSNENLVSELGNAKLKCAELTQLLASSEERLKSYMEENEPLPGMQLKLLKEQYEEKEKDLLSKIREGDLKIKALNSQLQTANKHMDQYKQISSSCEEALQDANKKYASLQNEFSSMSSNMERKVSDLSNKLAKINAETAAEKVKSSKALQGLRSEYDQLQKLYDALKKESDGTKDGIETYKRQCNAAQEEAKLHQATALETQEKYERELLLHAKDVDELVKIKEKIHEYEQSAASYEMKIKQAEKNLAAAETSMENIKLHCNEEVQKVREHSKQLSEQNTLLHKEVEKLSSQIVDAKSQKVDLIAKLTESGEKSKDQSTDDLYEVIRFIRREKEIAETKFEALQSENMRFRQRCEHFETELEETQAALDLERKRTLGLMLSKEEHDDLMSKVARVAELDVVNKDLQQQKDELYGEAESLKVKIKEFEIQISSLQDSRKSLEEEKGSWVAERIALNNEIQRWTTRTQQLVEQNKKFTKDLDELKQLQNSKAQNENVLGALKDENARLKGQKDTMTKEIFKLKKDAVETQGRTKLLTTLTDTIKAEKEQAQKQFDEEIEGMKKQLTEKANDISEKGKLIQKLKALARKYKSQYEELQKGKDTAQAKDSESAAEASSEPSSVDAKQSEEQDQASKKLAEQIEKMNSVQKENDRLKKVIEELEALLRESESSVVKSKESVLKDSEMEKKITELSEQVDTLTKENLSKKSSLDEKDARDERNKKLLRSAKEKINELTVQRDKLANENKSLRQSIKEEEEKFKLSKEEMNEREVLTNALKAQYEANVDRLKKELDQLNNEIEKLSNELKEMETRKRVAEEKSNELATTNAEKDETIAKLKSQLFPVKPIQDFTPAEPNTLAPLTATVRPTASTVTSQSQKPMHSTRTASIRPLIPNITPTAMVSPTVPPSHPSTCQGLFPPVNRTINTATAATVLLPPEPYLGETQSGPSRSQASVFKGPRVVAVLSQDGSTVSEIQATVSPIIAASNADEQPERSNQDDAEQIEEHLQQDTIDSIDNFPEDYLTTLSIPNEPADQERPEEKQPADSTSLDQAVTTGEELSLEPEEFNQGSSHIEISTTENASYLKRRRSESEDDSLPREELEEKRKRIEEGRTPPRETEVISISDGDDDVEDSDEREDDEEYDGAEDNDDEDNIDEMEEDSEVDDGVDEEEMFENEGQNEEYYDDDVEEGEVDDGDSEDDEMADDGDEDVGNEDENVMEEIEVVQSSNEQRDSSGNQHPGANISPMTIREPNREIQRRQPSPAAFMLATQDLGGRGRVFRRRYQLPSFSLPPGQGGSGPFDEADDCTVPSTPTLYEPKRSDGFAEAVSSPQVRHPVFSFPAGSEGASRSQSVGLETGVNDEGLRLDDTRIDLLAGEEPASVPSTPLGIVPSVTITTVEGEGEEVVNSRQDSNVGHDRHSTTERVHELMTEDASQEQNVPQQIDLTGDDEENVDNDVVDRNVNAEIQQEESTDLLGNIGQTGLPVEEIATIAHEDSKDMEATEQESIDLHQSEQEQQQLKSRKTDVTAPDPSQEVNAPTTSTSARPRGGRRPRIRRTVLQARGQAPDEKTEQPEP